MPKPSLPALVPKVFQWLNQPPVAYSLIAALACGLYLNTLTHDFVLDDGLVLSNNRIVQKGLTALPEILLHDSFYGAIGHSENLSGGRYRPLALITYAMEISLFGMDPQVHHFFNVVWYVLTCLALLQLLRRYIFPQKEIAALIAGLLFAVHPVHAEVVANIKSRDELLSLFFLVLTLMRLLTEFHRGQYPIGSAFFYLLALLAKENGIIFLVLLPLTLHVFARATIQKMARYLLPFLLPLGLYVWLRYEATGFRFSEVKEIMDNPYIHASLSEKWATILFVFLKYGQLLLFPWPLSYDYSFQHIPYRQWNDPWVWFSFLLHAGLIIHAIWLLSRRSILGWCIVFYLSTLLLVSNLLFNVGAPMAERFLFQASLPFVTGMVFTATNLLPRSVHRQPWQSLVLSVMVIAVATSGAILTVRRNADWRNAVTLFLTDVHKVPNSGRANTYAGIALLSVADTLSRHEQRTAYYQQAIAYFQKSLRIKQDYLPTLLHIGIAYSRLDSIERAEHYWQQAFDVAPTHANVLQYRSYLFQTFYRYGLQAGTRQQFDSAVYWLKKAVHYKPDDAETWYHLGGALYSAARYAEAMESFTKCLSLDSTHRNAQQGLRAAQYRLREEPVHRQITFAPQP